MTKGSYSGCSHAVITSRRKPEWGLPVRLLPFFISTLLHSDIMFLLTRYEQINSQIIQFSCLVCLLCNKKRLRVFLSENRLIELFPDLFLKQKFTILPSILAPQGVIKGRKRITLMVVAVSVTFAICWGTNQIDHAMYVASCDIGKVPVVICNIMVLSNSAVNALVYLSFSNTSERIWMQQHVSVAYHLTGFTPLIILYSSLTSPFRHRGESSFV